MLVWQSRGAGAMTGVAKAGATSIGLLGVTALCADPMLCRAFSTEPTGIGCAASWNHCGVWVTMAALTMVVAPILMVRLDPAINPSM
jgi:hypothetical protein